MLDLIPMPQSGHQWCLNYSWCGVRLDHRRRKLGMLVCSLPGPLQISLPIPNQVEEGCYQRQPLGLEAKSHNMDTHYPNLRSPMKQTNKQKTMFLVANIVISTTDFEIYATPVKGDETFSKKRKS